MDDRMWINGICGCKIMMWDSGEIQLITACHEHKMMCVKKALGEVMIHE